MQPWQHEVPVPPPLVNALGTVAGIHLVTVQVDQSPPALCPFTAGEVNGTSHPTLDVRRVGELRATPSATSPLWLCRKPKITTSGILLGCVTLPEVNPMPHCCFFKKCKGERENPVLNASSFLISLPSFRSFFSLFKEDFELFHQLTTIAGKCMTLCSSMSGTSQPFPTTRIPKAGLLQLKTFPCRIFPCKNQTS